MDVHTLMGRGFAVSCKGEIDDEDFTPGIVKCKFVFDSSLALRFYSCVGHICLLNQIRTRVCFSHILHHG